MEYTPKIYKSGKDQYYVEMLLDAEMCPICNKIMIHKKDTDFRHSIFPYGELSQEEQAQKAGIVFMSDTKVDGENICIECHSAGKATFKCELCGEIKSINKIKESVGDPADYLCLDCYETVTAKVFDEKLEELEDEHKYDYE